MTRPVRKSSGNRLTAMMQVRNEADRYLDSVLRCLSEFVDDVVIVDDASTDGTPDLCRDFKKVVKLVVLPESQFRREWNLRSLLWDVAVSTHPDWLLAVDADELYEDRAKEEIRALIDQDQYDWVAFRMFDMWGGLTHYREDEHWNLHKRYTVTLVRFLPGYHYFFPPMDLHVPRVPLSYRPLPGLCSPIRIKHLGWVGPREYLQKKYERYMALDPDGRWGSLAQYEPFSMSLFPRTFSTNPIGVVSSACPLSGLSSTGWVVQAMLNQGQVLGYLAQELHLLRSRAV